MSTQGVGPRWLVDRDGELPDPEHAPSRADLWLWADIPAGTPPAAFPVPTVTDPLARPAESLPPALTRDNAEP
ncbi:hypothetical protein, partial [Streptomyces sp. GbtcB7]|uniref:hypothetical protein n=1 Tax=Streptomyces sp. GbtcB7 TaxID=2824752 RepID=UPI001C3105AF